MLPHPWIRDIVRVFVAWRKDERRASATPTHHLSLLLPELLDRANRADSTPRTRDRNVSKEDHELITAAGRCVLANIETPLTLEGIARKLSVSRSYLHKRCRAALRISPGAFFRNIRIRQACTLLENSDASVKEIAAQTGFSSVYAFSRSFKQKTGQAPSAYRAAAMARRAPS
jgi:AraC-like DNA-binding protein